MISIREGIEILSDTLLLIKMRGATSLVPMCNTGKHERYIKEFRGGDLVHFQNLLVDSVVGYEFERQEGDVLFYRGEDGEERTLKVDREIVYELEYGFVSASRLSGLVEVDADIERAKQAIAENEWVFAKSMPKNPHWYTLRHKWNDDILRFDDFVELIRREGCDQEYWKRMYRVMEIGDHFYWSMGAPVPITILINRKEL